MSVYLGSSIIDNLLINQLVLGQNLPIRTPVQVATTVAGTLGMSFVAGSTIDGYVLLTNDRILIKNQATSSENGIYVVSASGAPVRANDLLTGSHASGILITCINGTSGSAGIFICTNPYNSDVVGTASLSFNRAITAPNTSSGITPVSIGGTGLSTLPSGYFLTGNGTSNVLTTYAAPSGTVVGTTDTQTLTNKTLTTPTISNLTLSGTSSNLLTISCAQSYPSITLSIPNLSYNDTIATQGYVQSFVQGLQIKNSCQAATVGANINLSTPGFTTLDGVTLSSGVSRILVKDQTTGSQNGIYTFNGSSGAMARTSDFNTGTVTSGAFTFIENGTINGSTGWVLTTPDPITIGTTSITFTQFSGAGTYIAGNGISLNGTVISTNLFSNGGLVLNGSALQVNLGASAITGTVATTNGGTGLTSFTNNTFLTSSSTSALVSSKVVPSGVVIGTTDTQTLTNKTLTSPNLGTISNYLTLSTGSQSGAGVINFPNLGTGSDTIATLAATQSLTNKTITSGKFNLLEDVNGNIIIGLTTTTSAVNSLNISNNSTGNDPQLSAVGSDTSVNLSFGVKGSGVYKLLGATNPAALYFYNAANTNYTGLIASSSSSGAVFTLPASAGTANQAIITNGSGNVLTFATQALNRTPYNLLTAQVAVNLNSTANNPSNILPNSLFPWSQTRNSTFTTGTVVARIGNQTNNNVTLTLYSIAASNIVNPITSVSSGNLTSLGYSSSTGTADSNIVFTFTLPTSDCLLVLTAITSTTSGIQPTINGLMLELNQ